VEQQHAVRSLELGGQRETERVRIHDARARRDQAGDGPNARLAPRDLCAVDQLQARRTVLAPALLELLQHRDLGLVGGHDQLPELAVRNAMLGAARVEPFPTLDAHARLPGIARVVDPRVDHPAVATGGLPGDPAVALENDDAATCARQRGPRGEADDPAAHHDHVDVRRHGFRRRRLRKPSRRSGE
jgi:hypothetical protein